MKKNEQLFRAIGKISPTYIEMAADGRRPGKRERRRAARISLRPFGLIAAMISLSVIMFALGFSVSATEPDPELEEYATGTLMMDIPEIITDKDYQDMYARIEAGLAEATEFPEKTRGHWLERFDAFWALHDPELAKSNKQREAMRMAYPIVEVTPVRTVDMFLTECERDFLYHMMVTYGEMTQLDLITIGQNLHVAAEQSTLSAEQKQVIDASLPEIPTGSSGAPPANYLTAEAEAAGKTQMTPVTLPFVLLPEDYASIRDAVLAKYGVESEEQLPIQAKKLLNNYTKYPLELSNPENYQVMTAQHFAELTANEELYIIDPTLPIEERVMLCYGLAMEADVWGEDGSRMAKNLYDKMEERYPREMDPTFGRVRGIIMSYWNNWIGAQECVMDQ